jgi:hypothetical protein
MRTARATAGARQSGEAIQPTGPRLGNSESTWLGWSASLMLSGRSEGDSTAASGWYLKAPRSSDFAMSQEDYEVAGCWLA